MRTISDALAYIDTLTSYSLERPEMYARNPIALEAILVALDDLRAFLKSNDETELFFPRSRYGEFLGSKGFGVSTFTGRCYPDVEASERDREVFPRLCEFWREYLSARDHPDPFPQERGNGS